MTTLPSAPNPLELSPTATGTQIKVRVIPNAARTQVAGLRRGAILCRLAAPPVDGAANEALATLLAQALTVRRSAVQIRKGQRTRDKLVVIEGLTGEVLRARLGAILST